MASPARPASGTLDPHVSAAETQVERSEQHAASNPWSSGVPSVAATAVLLAVTPPARGQSVQVEEADVLAELNDTDGDLGFHALIDADAWGRADSQ